MARRELGPAALHVAQAVTGALSGVDGPLVVGVSGGADSLALAAATAWAARRLPVEPLAVVVDHGLQDGSADVARAAARQCEGLGLVTEVMRVHVVAGDDGPEAAARRARYEALESRPGPILLAHTRDDQAETVLLRLARGGGTRALAGMRPVAGRLLRPLLEVPRSTVRAACREWDLTPWEDPHNVDRRYSRARVRHVVLPMLEDEVGPGVAAALARTAAQARADADCLDEIASTYARPEALPVAAVKDLPDAVRTRVLLAWLRDRGCPGGADAVARVDDLVLHPRGQGPLALPGGTVARSAGLLQWHSGQ